MIDREGYAQAMAYQTADHREGLKAFKEKRQARFIGR
jgi:1,4-dihydroxy-2-naphthoyl-CoA synthase